MKDRKKVRKWWFVWKFEKHEQWLNEMAMSGWVLDQVSFCSYTFVKGEPEEYIVRMESHNFDDEYLEFMKGLGAEYIGRETNWIYFRRKSELGEFNIFSDIDSRLAHLNKIAKMIAGIGIANIGIGLANTFNPVVNCGFINLLCGCLLMYALGRIRGKTEELEKERTLHE